MPRTKQVGRSGQPRMKAPRVVRCASQHCNLSNAAINLYPVQEQGTPADDLSDGVIWSMLRAGSTSTEDKRRAARALQFEARVLDADQRSEHARRISSFVEGGVLERLISLLGDGETTEPAARAMAYLANDPFGFFSMSGVGSDQSLIALVELLQDGSPASREAAAMALGNLASRSSPDSSQAKVFVDYYNNHDTNTSSTKMFAVALGNLGSVIRHCYLGVGEHTVTLFEGALGLLVGFLREGDAEIKLIAAKALELYTYLEPIEHSGAGYIFEADATEPLIKLLFEGHDRESREAARSVLSSMAEAEEGIPPEGLQPADIASLKQQLSRYEDITENDGGAPPAAKKQRLSGD